MQLHKQCGESICCSSQGIAFRRHGDPAAAWLSQFAYGGAYICRQGWAGCKAVCDGETWASRARKKRSSAASRCVWARDTDSEVVRGL